MSDDATKQRSYPYIKIATDSFLFFFLDCGVSFLVRRIRMYSLLVLVFHLNQPSCQQPSRSGRMAGGGTGIRKYMGALKDTTTVSIAKVNSDYKVMIAIPNFKAPFQDLSLLHLVMC